MKARDLHKVVAENALYGHDIGSYTTAMGVSTWKHHSDLTLGVLLYRYVLCIIGMCY